MARPARKRPAARAAARGPGAEEVQASIVAGSDDAVIGKTLDGTITVWNDGARRLYGWTAREAVGRSIRMLVPPDREAELERVMELVKRGESVSHLETVRRRKDGTLAEVSLTVSPIRAGRRVIGASSVARDVGARNRAERRFRLVVEGTPNALIMADTRGRIVLVNSQAEKLFGYSRAELLGLTVEDLVPRRYRSGHAGLRARFADDPQARSMGAGRELFAVRKDGSEVPVEIGLNPLREGEEDFVLASIIDISERERAERRFRLVVEGTPNALVMADESGRVVLANSQAEKLFGYSREELLALTVEDLVPRRYRGGHAARRAEFAADPRARAMGAGRNLFAARKDGTEVPVEIGLTPLQEGSSRFVLASIIDISGRRALEKKLAHSETLATIGSMAAVMGHEIRNPLSSIVMAARALTRGSLAPEDHAQVMSVLLDESQRLQRVLEDFLQYSRPRVPKSEPGDINKTVREVLNAATADTALVGEARVDSELDPRAAPLSFDADQIRQVLWNLVRNGFQALGGRGRLTVRTEGRAAEVEIRVADDGPGIPSDELESVFTPFFTTKTKGTGLGLAISRNIVLSHGGTIRAESGKGKGCAFVIVLPR